MKFFRTLITVGRFGIKLADKGGFMKKRIIFINKYIYRKKTPYSYDINITIRSYF